MVGWRQPRDRRRAPRRGALIPRSCSPDTVPLTAAASMSAKTPDAQLLTEVGKALPNLVTQAVVGWAPSVPTSEPPTHAHIWRVQGVPASLGERESPCRSSPAPMPTSQTPVVRTIVTCDPARWLAAGRPSISHCAVRTPHRRKPLTGIL